MLEIRVLGGLEVVRDGVPATLPPSRKTRALIAYLTLTPGRHSREQLCEMFWDVPDDPRGSLRWSLSKIRRIVDETSVPRLLADRQNVELRTEAADVDFLAAQAVAGLAGTATQDLAGAAKSFRGPLLSDLDLPENSGYHTWLLGMREDARKLQARILRSVTERVAATPEEALPYARELVGIDPFDEDAWALLITTLAEAGRSGELRPQFEAGLRKASSIASQLCAPTDRGSSASARSNSKTCSARFSREGGLSRAARPRRM